jgi:hypothetical protein
MGTQDGVGQNARFGFISGITSHGNYIYVASDHAIRRIDESTADVTTWVGTAGQAGYTEGQGNAARLDGPVGIATDGTTMWVAEQGNNVIRAIDMSNAQTSTLAGQQGSSGSTDGTGAAARFENTRDLAWDGAYLWHIQSNGVLRRIDTSSGEVITVAGQAGQTGFADGQGNAARFDAPRFVEPVSANRFYVSDTENHRPRLVTVAGTVGTVTSPYGGTAGYADAQGTNAQFRRQRGIGYAGANILTVADSDNYVIREIDLQTTDVSTIAGMAGNATHVVGEALMAGFDKPLDMHYDAGSGDLFISEGSVLRRMYYQ